MSKSISESTLAELLVRREKHLFCLKLIDMEIAKKRGKTIIIKKTASNEPVSEKKVSPIKTATRDDMKAVLKKSGIEFKESAKKAELQELVRKHNLVRIVDTYHKERAN